MRLQSKGEPADAARVEVDDHSPTPMPTVEGVEPTPIKRAAPLRFRHRLDGSLARSTALWRRGRTLALAKPRKTASIAFAIALVGCVVPLAAMRSKGAADTRTETSSSATVLDSITSKTDAASSKTYVPTGALAGLDLKSMAVDDNGVVASAAGGRVARLTVDPKMQNSTMRLLTKSKVPQAAVVLIEPSTGKILAYASKGGDGKDLAVEADAPSASVFKIITGSALVQVASVPIDTKMCYGGGEQKILAVDLKDDPKRDLYCATLAQAMGRSINAIFAKLASRKLTAPDLNAIASQFGYGGAIPFDVPVAVSKIDLPTDPLAFARTAAGFWNTSLSPLHGALIAATIANGGVMMRPFIVDEVLDGTNVIYKAPVPSTLRKVIEPATATAVGTMMLETTTNGTSFKAFHDGKGKAFIPGVEIAGKTGTLNQTQPAKLFTWFVGFAPAKAPKIAIATLVVNDPVWKVKANVLAREVLQAYFAAQGAPGVQAPPVD